MIFVLILALLNTQSAFSYYGRHSTEAILTFNGRIEVPSQFGKRQIHKSIDLQIQHLMGTFQSLSFLDSFRYPGGLGEEYSFNVTSVGKSRNGRKEVHYQFQGKVVFKKDAFRSGKERNIPLKLPLAPDQIYSLGLVEQSGTWVNACTDHHYNSEGDFWYFWDPDQEGCPLAEDDVNVLRIQGRLKPLPNTELTYPEYDKIFGKNGNGSQTDLVVVVGYVDDVRRQDRPNRRDDAYLTFRQLEGEMELEGFVLNRLESKKAFQLDLRGNEFKGGNYYSVYQKKIRRFNRDVDLRVRLLLTDTSAGSADPTFHKFAQDFFENSDLFIYDGHSGLGGNLHLEVLPPISFARDKYQLFFFNGCSTYPYFNGMFFDAKGGSKNLDLILSGLPTLSLTSGPNTMAFLRRFLDDSKGLVSYQKLLSELEQSNEQEGVETYLVGVVGDEDNQFRP